MERKFFGTDGIRGRANAGVMTAATAMAVGQAAGTHFLRGAHRHRVVIGKDTRLSGYMMETALVAGFTSVGMDVIMTGPLPTPAIALLTREMRADLGVMISASHNPYEDNGIKLFGPNGFKLSDADEEAIEHLMERGNFSLAEGKHVGRARRIDDAPGRYIHAVKGSVAEDIRFDDLKVVLDCANGAAYQVTPTAIWELGAELVSIGVNPNGTNINDNVGSTSLDTIKARVVAEGADIGLALDGDADRLIVVDEKGQTVDGDQLMALIAGQLAEAGQLRGGGVVATVMSNLGLERYLQARGLELVRAKVGDRYVLEELEKHGWILGGEGSGHLLVLDRHTTGDGLVSALQVLHACVDSGKTMAQLLADVTLFPQTLINVRLQPGQDWKTNTFLTDETHAVETELGETGRVLIRASGTEPLLRVMVEARDAQQAQACAERLVAAVRAQVPA
jgi:phosphoglucosamine mutase